MNRPFFSIVIPVYNRGELLSVRLKEIFLQTYTSFEVIVVDDGSKEDIESILNKSLPNVSGLQILHQINSERGVARNNGFRNAKGQYVVFFDSDDIMHANHLQVLYDNIQKLNQPDFIATFFDFVDANNRHYPSDIIKLKEGHYDYRLFLNGNPLACNICVRKDNPKLQLFEEDRKFAIKEDWMFMISNMKHSSLYIVPEITISMYDHQDRSMRSDNKIIIQKTHFATDWIITNIVLSESELRQLHAHENYFCGIHWYLESNRIDAMRSAFRAIQFGGFQLKYFSLFLKSLIGRKLISSVK